MLKSLKARKWLKASREANRMTNEMFYSSNLIETGEFFDFSDGKIMLWTGAMDAFKKEIYDADILEILDTGKRYLLSYFQDIARFYLIEIGTQKIIYLDEVNLENAKVLGNYYENPDLLAGQPLKKQEDIA